MVIPRDGFFYPTLTPIMDSFSCSPLFLSIHLIIPNKSENATLQLSIFQEKVLDKKYLLKLNNVAQTSSKRFVETPPICLV